MSTTFPTFSLPFISFFPNYKCSMFDEWTFPYFRWFFFLHVNYYRQRFYAMHSCYPLLIVVGSISTFLCTHKTTQQNLHFLINSDLATPTRLYSIHWMAIFFIFSIFSVFHFNCTKTHCPWSCESRCVSSVFQPFTLSFVHQLRRSTVKNHRFNKLIAFFLFLSISFTDDARVGASSSREEFRRKTSFSNRRLQLSSSTFVYWVDGKLLSREKRR